MGVLDWRGEQPPTGETVRGNGVTQQALTRIEIFTTGGCKITGNSEVGQNPWPSNFRDFAIGTTHAVWG